MAAATGTYYALLFTLAQYLQQGTGHSALDSGLMVVPWVAAFGLSGQVNRRLRDEWAARTPAVGCLALAAVYLAISVDLFLGDHGQARLAGLLAVGGFALGIQFNATLALITGSVSERHAPDVTGTSSMMIQIAGVTAIAAFGTLYVRLAHRAGSTPDVATHASAVTVALFAVAALGATGAARLAEVSGRRRSGRRSGVVRRPSRRAARASARAAPAGSRSARRAGSPARGPPRCRARCRGPARAARSAAARRPAGVHTAYGGWWKSRGHVEPALVGGDAGGARAARGHRGGQRGDGAALVAARRSRRRGRCRARPGRPAATAAAYGPSISRAKVSG